MMGYNMNTVWLNYPQKRYTIQQMYSIAFKMDYRQKLDVTNVHNKAVYIHHNLKMQIHGLTFTLSFHGSHLGFIQTESSFR